MEITINEILEAFKTFDGTYKREQVDAAIELKAEITPYLIKILENVLDDPSPYIEDENLYDHIYALMLLGHFRESKAHKVIIDLFSLPEEIPHDLFSDLATSDLPTILLRTCGGSLERIKSMALNKQVDVYCRISALNALAYAVVEGIASRKEILSFFGTLFTGNEADADSEFWGFVAGLVCDLYPEELMDTITKGYEEDLIFSGIVGYGEFKKALADGKEKCLERLKADLERRSLDDIHAAMSWWACFNEEPPSAAAPNSFIETKLPANLEQSEPKLKIKKKKDKKKKRKQAKASKRKNRR
jgi:hypothetical protein